MENKEQDNNIDSDIYLFVEGSPTTYAEFYADNTAEDVESPSDEDFEMVKNLKVGEDCQVGWVEIKRISKEDYEKK